jgi:hypothetical protein
MSKTTDPRDASLESKVVFPYRWPRDYMGNLSISITCYMAHLFCTSRCLEHFRHVLGRPDNGDKEPVRATIIFLSPAIIYRTWYTPTRYMAWPSLILAINGLINQHPLREKESASSPWATLL